MVESRTITVEDLLAQADWLRRLAGSIARDDGEAEDLAQETLSTALASPPRDGGGLRGWLATVLRRHAARRRRRSAARVRREAAVGTSAEVRDPAEIVARVELQRIVAGEVLRLREPYRSLVVWRYFEDRTPGEISRMTGVPAGTVRVRLHRARAELRRRLDDRHGGDRRTWLVPLLVGGALMSRTKIAVAAVGALFLLTAGVTVALGPDPVPPEPPARVAEAPVPPPGEGPAGLSGAAEERPAPPAPASRTAGPRAVRGRVVTPGGSPVARALVYIVDAEGRPRTSTIDHRTDEHGAFALTGLTADGPLDLVVDAQAYRPAILALAGLPERGAEVVLDPGLSIRGIVVDDAGRPVRTAIKARRLDRDRWTQQVFSRRDTVRNGALTRSDTEGRFEVRGLGAGRHRVEKATLNYLDGRSSTVECDAGETGVNLVLYPAVTLKILVRDGGGARLREPFDVRILYEDGRPDKSASHRGTSGEMLLRGVSPGRCRIECRVVNHFPAVLEAVELEAGPEPRVVEIRMDRRAEHGFGRLLGEVRGADGGLPSRVELSAKLLETGPWTGFPVDAGGGFHVPGLPTGLYHVRVESADGAWISRRVAVRVTAGSDASVLLTLERAGAARLVVRSRAGCEAESVDYFLLDAEGFAVLRGRSDAEERSVAYWEKGHRVGPLVPGAYRAVAAVGDRLLTDAEVVVAAGEERAVTLVLPRRPTSLPAPTPRTVREVPWSLPDPPREEERPEPPSGDWISRLRSGSARERFEAASKLSEEGTADAVDPLLRVLAEDRDLFVRRAAILALARIGDERAVPGLIRALAADSSFVAGPASAAIQEITGRRPAWRPGLTRSERERLVEEALARWEDR